MSYIENIKKLVEKGTSASALKKRSGSKQNIVALQYVLNQLGFEKDLNWARYGADGDYGGSTTKAVKSYAQNNSLQGDGTAVTTEIAISMVKSFDVLDGLNILHRAVQTGQVEQSFFRGSQQQNSVIALQTLLHASGFGAQLNWSKYGADGDYGGGTTKALKAFAEQYSIQSNGEKLIVELAEKLMQQHAAGFGPDWRADPLGHMMPEHNMRTEVRYSSRIPDAKQIVSSSAIAVIQSALAMAGMSCAVITDTIRTPEEQARIMYRNAKKDLIKQFRLYGRVGDQVLKVYEANSSKSKQVVINLMTAKIKDLLKSSKRTSKHVVTETVYATCNIIDIGSNSTKSACGTSFHKNRFTDALNELKKMGHIDKVIDETGKSNQCWHIEIKPNLTE